MKKVPAEWFLFIPSLLFLLIYILMNVVFTSITDRHLLPTTTTRLNLKNRKPVIQEEEFLQDHTATVHPWHAEPETLRTKTIQPDSSLLIAFPLRQATNDTVID